MSELRQLTLSEKTVSLHVSVPVVKNIVFDHAKGCQNLQGPENIPI